VFQNISLSLVPAIYVAFVNALQGIQYVCLLVFGVLVAKFHPKAQLHEYVSGTSLAQKILGIACISAGLVIIALGS
jgi:hypothetical protein